MKKMLLSLLMALVALVMACGNRAEARVSVSVNLGCPAPVYVPCRPHYCVPCPPPYYVPPCHPLPPRHCHVHRPHHHHSCARPQHGHHGPMPAGPHRVPRGQSRR